MSETRFDRLDRQILAIGEYAHKGVSFDPGAIASARMVLARLDKRDFQEPAVARNGTHTIAFLWTNDAALVVTAGMASILKGGRRLTPYAPFSIEDAEGLDLLLDELTRQWNGPSADSAEAPCLSSQAPSE